MIDWQEVKGWLYQGASERTDVLKGMPRVTRIAESLVAMANGSGGVLIVAVSNRDQADELVDRAMEAALMAQPPLVLPLPEILDEEPGSMCVVVLMVPRGMSSVHSLQGRYLVRRGRRNEPLTTENLRRLLVSRGQVTFDAWTAPDAELGDLDRDAVEAYTRRIAASAPVETDADLIRLLRRRGMLNADGVPTMAGALLFAREPERFVRCCEIVAVRYPGREMGDRFVREGIRGRLPDQIQRAHAFCLANMGREAGINGLERVERLQYPEEAVREAIVNAVAHRDYAIAGEAIRVLMFSDRIEVYSPGRLAGQVTLENLQIERYSRNPSIVQALADLGYVERLGYGIDRMMQLMALEGLPAPEFEEMSNGFRVTLYGTGEMAPTALASRRSWQAAGLNPRQVALLEYLDEHPHISAGQYRDLCPEVSDESRRRDLSGLVKRGILLKIGQKRGTYYVLK